MSKMPKKFLNRVICADCMSVLRELPDKCVDLILTDPPYGIGIAKNPIRQMHEKKDWDEKTPAKEYFDEMIRVSKNQIIWGGNYFDLPPSQGFLIWDKEQPESFSTAMCEQAWMSFQSPAKMYRYRVVDGITKLHPTQKPVKLMEWCLQRYSAPGEIVLDPFAGSGSTLVAALRLQQPFIGIELCEEYCKVAEQRLEKARNTRIVDFFT